MYPRAAFAFTLALAITLLAACSGSGGNDPAAPAPTVEPASTTAPAATSAAATPEAPRPNADGVLIAVIAPEADPPAAAGIALALEDAPAAMGAKSEVWAADGAEAAEAAVSAAADAGAAAIVALLRGESAGAAAAAAENAGLPIVFAVSGPVYPGPLTFRSAPSAAQIGETLAKEVQRREIVTVAAMHAGDAEGQEAAAAFAAAVAGAERPAPGADPGGAVEIGEGVSWEDAAASVVRDGRADAIAFFGGADAAAGVRAAAAAGFAGPFLFGPPDGRAAAGAALDALTPGSFGAGAASGDLSDPSDAAWRDLWLVRRGAGDPPAGAREAYDAAIAILLGAALAPGGGGAALAAAMRDASGPPGEIVLPGEIGKEHWARPGSVDFDGAATWLDWSEAGEPSAVWVQLWTADGGGIEDVLVVAAGEGAADGEALACLGAADVLWITLLGAAMESVLEATQSITLAFFETGGADPAAAGSAWQARAIAAADEAETAGRELGEIASAPPPSIGPDHPIARESRAAGESFAEAAEAVRDAIGADTAAGIARHGERAQAASAEGGAAMERAVAAMAALCGDGT